jgi:uncharacterized integral membrane protein (TIGR00697 family)
MNELLFLAHLFAIAVFVLVTSRMGKAALICLAVLQAILANLFVVKQTILFGLSVTCSDVFAIGGIWTLNLLQEFWGKEAVQTAIKISFLSLVFFTLMAQIHLLYMPSAFDETDASFHTIFSSGPRIVLASIAVCYIVQKIDVQLFGWLQKLFKGSKLPIRIGLSLILTQFIDTVLFSVVGLWGLMASLFDVIFMSFLMKTIIILNLSTVTAFSKRFLRKANAV